MRPTPYTAPLPSFATALAALRECAPLWDCPGCRGSLVQAVSAERTAASAWRVARRCPNCGHEDVTTAARAHADAFHDALLRGHEQLLADYREMVRANMREDVERFVAALDAGAVQPFDF